METIKPKCIWHNNVIYIINVQEYRILSINSTIKPAPMFFLHLHLVIYAFIQSDLQMRTMETIKIKKRPMIRKCYNKSQLV